MALFEFSIDDTVSFNKTINLPGKLKARTYILVISKQNSGFLARNSIHPHPHIFSHGDRIKFERIEQAFLPSDTKRKDPTGSVQRKCHITNFFLLQGSEKLGKIDRFEMMILVYLVECQRFLICHSQLLFCSAVSAATLQFT